MTIIITVLLLVIILQLWRLEHMLQSVCRNQVTTAKLLGRAYNIGVVEKHVHD